MADFHLLAKGNRSVCTSSKAKAISQGWAMAFFHTDTMAICTTILTLASRISASLLADRRGSAAVLSEQRVGRLC